MTYVCGALALTMPAAPRWCGYTSLIASPQYFGPRVIHTPPGNAVQRYSDGNVRLRVMDRC